MAFEEPWINSLCNHLQLIIYLHEFPIKYLNSSQRWLCSVWCNFRLQSKLIVAIMNLLRTPSQQRMKTLLPSVVQTPRPPPLPLTARGFWIPPLWPFAEPSTIRTPRVPSRLAWLLLQSSIVTPLAICDEMRQVSDVRCSGYHDRSGGKPIKN